MNTVYETLPFESQKLWSQSKLCNWNTKIHENIFTRYVDGFLHLGVTLCGVYFSLCLVCCRWFCSIGWFTAGSGVTLTGSPWQYETVLIVQELCICCRWHFDGPLVVADGWCFFILYDNTTLDGRLGADSDITWRSSPGHHDTALDVSWAVTDGFTALYDPLIDHPGLDFSLTLSRRSTCWMVYKHFFTP